MDAFKGLTASNNSWANMISLPHYQERVTYDANGNILTYKRNGNKTSQQLMDDLTYAYNKDANGKLINNRLRHVTDAVTNTAAYDESDAASGVSDIESQATDNYAYDQIGNLIKDTKENITSINWNVYGKITDINFGFVANKPKKITFSYDASGNRITKQVEKYGTTSGATTTSSFTWYVRDASGNVMGVYNSSASGTTVPTAISVGERHLYGSSRLGVLNLTADSKVLPQALSTAAYSSTFIRGNKYYELSNHLGNVLSTVSDKKIAVDDGTYDAGGNKLNSTADGKIDYYLADVVTANDYYPFGMLQPGRKYSAGSGYRYGFNGKENDKDVKGDGNQQDYGMRIYDPRLGKFLSVDPLTNKYPELTPYQFASDRPIAGIDLDGLEFYYAADGKFLGSIGTSQEVYTADKLEAKTRVSTDEKGNSCNDIYLEAVNAKSLGVTQSVFISRAATAYGESSHGMGIDSKEEVWAIATTHKKNKIAYGATNPQAKIFKNTKNEDRNNTFMQVAIAGQINAELGSPVDYSNGATMWDGSEQTAFAEDDDRFTTGKFEIHMNTMGWKISDDNYDSWKKAVGKNFKVPKLKYTPGKAPGNKYATANTIALVSTAQYGKTIFWKELKIRLKKPEEKKDEKQEQKKEEKPAG